MLSKTWNWIKQNKWKSLAISAAIGGTIWYASRPSQLDDSETQKQKKSLYWRDSQIAADRTIQHFVEILATNAKSQTKLSETLSLLRNPENTPEIREKLFNDLKISAFSANLLFMYNIVLISTYLRISVNVVGRHLFDTATQNSTFGPSTIDIIKTFLPKNRIMSIITGEDDVPTRPIDDNTLLTISPEIQRKCLASTEFFLEHGLPILSEVIKEACVGTLQNHSLDEDITEDTMLDIFLHIRNLVEAQFPRSFERHVQDQIRSTSLLEAILLPPENTTTPYSFTNEEDAIFNSGVSDTDIIRMLINEKRNVIESVAYQSLFQHCLNTAFATLSETLSSMFQSTKPKIPQAQNEVAKESSENQESNQIDHSLQSAPHTIKLAKLLPLLSKHFNQITKVEDNQLVDRLTCTNELNEFSYRVFHGPVQLN